jgi:hypothetical protein
LNYTINNKTVMPNLNHTGPESEGSKTGRKLGKCKKSKEVIAQVGQIGIGLGKRKHSGGGKGKGKSLKTYKNI